MKILSFEGTPAEFAQVEHIFAGGVATTGSAVKTSARSRGLSWHDYTAEQRYAIARRCLEQTTPEVKQALIGLARLDDFGHPQSLDDWAQDAEMLPDELCGHIAEMARGVRRATIELFGDATPVTAKGAAEVILKKEKEQDRPTYFGIGTEARKAMADLGILEEHVE